jgi:hypothetical protein
MITAPRRPHGEPIPVDLALGKGIAPSLLECASSVRLGSGGASDALGVAPTTAIA